NSASQVKPGRTLQALYLDPLRNRAKQNGGRIFPNGPEFTLLIDLKTKWPLIYPALKSVLKEYAEVLTTFEGEKTNTNAIRVIVSGDRSKEMFDGEQIRYAALDGDQSFLDSDESASLVPWIS